MLSPRQIHLDFHTSENIPGVARRFDAQEFAQMARDAHVSSMTVFARGHHGWLYYDSRQFPELVHPHLTDKNLLPEQVRALHAQGIRAPIYITVQWDYHSATTRPEWLIRRRDGSHEGGPFTEPGFYQSLCVNTGYYDFLVAQTREICALLGDELDGVFFDIVGIRPCLCAACRREMKQRGIDASSDGAVREFAAFVLNRFKERMTGVVREYSADCTIFYNAGHVGPCTRDSAAQYTHFELESLPSGGWGYLHFPVTARYARKLGYDCMGMTGKFHTSWGDFHSLKNLAALEFEAFRMLSFGFACSIGDQLEPNGKLNPATYRLIGRVYEPFEQREQWARPSTPLAEAAVITSENPLYEHQIPDGILGAAQLLEELSLQFDIIDETMSLNPYRLVIVPADVKGTEALQAKIQSFVEKGGRVIACGRGAMNGQGLYPPCFGAQSAGDTTVYPDFILPGGALAGGLDEDGKYAIYMQGVGLSADGGEVALWAVAPYFKREGDRFCSHRYTPSADSAPYPAAIRTGNTILFSHPMFAQYRDNAPHWVKRIMANAIDALLPRRLVRHDGASTVSVQLLDQPRQNRTCVHILSYIPVRKSATIDIIEERTAACGLTLTLDLPRKFTKARLVPEGIPLETDGATVKIPRVDGYGIVELT